MLELHDRLLFKDFAIGIRNFANHRLNSMQFNIVLQVPTFIMSEFRNIYFSMHGLKSVQRTEHAVNLLDHPGHLFVPVDT